MTKITPDNFAEYSPSLRRSQSPEGKRGSDKDYTLPKKLTKELKHIRAQQQRQDQSEQNPDQPTASDNTNNDHSSGIKNV